VSLNALLKAADLEGAIEMAGRSDARLVLLVGENPRAIRESASAAGIATGWRTVDLNRDLSQRLIPHTAAERRVIAWDAFEEVVGDPSEGVVLLTSDVLFEPSLGYRPYEAIRRLARRGPVIAAWFGTVQGEFITRAHPGHPEYVNARLDVPYLAVPGKKGAGA
jgi:hypothetical protein